MIKQPHIILYILLVISFASGADFCAGKVIYVKEGSSSNGSSWDNACGTLQYALDNAVSGDAIWVSGGTYKPTEKVGGSTDRYKAFQMKSGVAIYGGFPDIGNPTWGDRNPDVYESVLSGDLAGNDVEVNDPCDLLIELSRGENCYHIFYHPSGFALNSEAVLDGFTVTAGNADISGGAGGGIYNSGTSDEYISCRINNCIFLKNSASKGGALYNSFATTRLNGCKFIRNYAADGGGICSEYCTLTLSDCQFSYNSANNGAALRNSVISDASVISGCSFTSNTVSSCGGAVYNTSASRDTYPTFSNCSFTGNSAGGGAGGAMYNDYGVLPNLINCSFVSNQAATEGGAMKNSDCSPNLTDCVFRDNHSADRGGAIYNYHSCVKIDSCIFQANMSQADGAGVYNQYGSALILNCNFKDNHAEGNGGAIRNTGAGTKIVNCLFIDNATGSYGGALYNYCNGPDITNCTFVGNAADVRGGAVYNKATDSGSIMTNSILWYNSAVTNGGQIYNENNSNFTVAYSDIEGSWSGNMVISEDPKFVAPGLGNYCLDFTSLCIDAGDNAAPDIPDADINGKARIIETRAPVIDMGAYEFSFGDLADFDKNGVINFVDFAILANSWLTGDPLIDIFPFDIHDGVVDEKELAVLSENWLVGNKKTCYPVEIPDYIVWRDTPAVTQKCYGPRTSDGTILWSNNNSAVIGVREDTGVITNAGRPCGYISKAVFTGSGLDDLKEGNSFYGNLKVDYTIEIDGTGPAGTADTFRWSTNGGAGWIATNVPITGGAQTLNNGFTVSFGTAEGHTMGDRWDISCSTLYSFWIFANDAGGLIGFGSPADDRYKWNIQKSTDGWSDFVQTFRDSREISQDVFAILVKSIVNVGQNRLLLFEYTNGTPSVYGSRDAGDSWSKLFQVTGSAALPIRHFHIGAYIPGIERLYVSTGDAWPEISDTANRMLICDDINDFFDNPENWKEYWGLNGTNDVPQEGYYAGYSTDGTATWKTVDILFDDTYIYWGTDHTGPEGTSIYRMKHSNVGHNELLGTYPGTSWYGCMTGKNKDIPVFTVKSGPRENGKYRDMSDEYIRLVAVDGDRSYVIRKWRRPDWDKDNVSSSPYSAVAAADAVWIWYTSETETGQCGIVERLSNLASYEGYYPWIFSQDKSNYIRNPQFESGVIGSFTNTEWAAYAYCEAGSGVSTADSEPGFARSMKIIYNHTKAYTIFRQVIEPNIVAQLAGNVVTLACSIKAGSGVDAQSFCDGLIIDNNNGALAPLFGKQWMGLSDYDQNWHELVLTVYVPADSTSLAIKPRVNNGSKHSAGTTFYFSDFRLSKGNVVLPKKTPSYDY